MSPKILLVEDEKNFGYVLRDFLQMNDFEVTLCEDGVSGWDAFQEGAYDLCVLDIMMPRKDGFTLAEDIRKQDARIPIIFLTARGMKEDMIKGFRIGADDYITKPFDSEVLLLRIRAILKRTVQTHEAGEEKDEFAFGSYRFNYRLHTVYNGVDSFKLSPKEASLLRMLLLRKNDLLSREEALNKLWGDDNYFNARSMDVFISKLRKRFKPDDKILIENVHGKGFRLVIED